ncbi:uncharacterized protein LOC120125738 isoform X2 [Hibiscus syriacus]|nr:uncharacterized protein LOC120125738 isoform X2 [Hibiscus syriacus]
MKKRSCESIVPPLPDSKKTNHKLGGDEVHRKNGLKKPKLNSKGEAGWSRKATVSGPITKDEEEVVKTLYALAGMFPDDDSMDKDKMNGEPIEVKASAPPETVTAIEVKKEDTNKVRHPQAAETVPPFTVEDSTNDAAKLKSLNETTSQDQPNLPGSRKPHFEQDSAGSKMRQIGSISFLARSEPEVDNSSCIPGDSHVLSELILTGLKRQLVTNLFERKAEMAFGVTASESQMAEQNIIKEPRKNGLALWQSSAIGPITPGSSKSFANKFPAWLDAAIYGPRTCSLESGSLTEKASKVAMDRKSTKRCVTHIYISRLIRNLQMHNKDITLQQPLQLKPHRGVQQTALLYPNDRGNLRNAVNGNIPSSYSGNSAPGRNDYETRNGILQPKIFYQEHPQVASASGRNTSNKQTLEFLSLSTGGISMEVNNNSIKVGNAIESLSQFQGKVPYLHSFQQHQSLVPFSVPATCYTDPLSTATATQQVQPQLPQYPSNPFCVPPYMCHSGVTKQQQHQRLWAAHLATQYKPGGTSTVLTQFPSRQNGKNESCTSIPYAHNAIPPFSSLDIPSPKSNIVPQHQLLKMAISSSLPPTRAKRSDHHLPSIYDERNGRLRTGGTLSLQLLCDERL